MSTPTDVLDARWRVLFLARASGEPLTLEEQRFLQWHRPKGELDRVHAALVDACIRLGHAEREPVGPRFAEDDTLVARTVEAFLAA